MRKFYHDETITFNDEIIWYFFLTCLFYYTRTHTHTHTHTRARTHRYIYICVCVCGCECIMNFSPSYFSVLFSQFAFFFELLWWSNFVKIATFGRCLFSQKSFVVGVQLVSKCVFAFYYISFKFSSAELFFLCSVD